MSTAALGHNSNADKNAAHQSIINEEEYLQQRSSDFQYLDFHDYKLRKLKAFTIVRAIYSDLELLIHSCQRKYCLTSTQKGEKN